MNEVPGGPGHAERDRALFDAIAERYAAKDLLPAHRLARRCRLEQTLAAAPILPRISMLEVGCGAGFAARYLRRHYRRYLGIDHSRSLIELARRLNSGEGVSFQEVGIDQFETGERFGLVLLIGVLHHLDRAEGKVRSLVELLEPGGWLVANEPQPGNPLVRAARVLRKRVDRAYSSEQRELSREELSRMLAGAGLEDVRVRPQGVFSTPFAEVVMPLQRVVRPLSAAACALDRALERRFPTVLGRISWNLVAAGRKPTN